VGYKPFSITAEAFDTTQVYSIYLTPLRPPDHLGVEYIRSLHRSNAMLFAGYAVEDESGRPLGGVAVTATLGPVSGVTDATGFFVLVVPLSSPGLGSVTQRSQLLFQKSGFQGQRLLNVESWPDGEWILRVRLVQGSGEIIRDEAASRFREHDEPTEPDTFLHQQVKSMPDFQAASKLSEDLPLISLKGGAVRPSSEAFSVRVPQTIRVQTDSGISVLPFDFQCTNCESYLTDVLPSEWPPWFGDLNNRTGMNALLAGAVAVRTYGAYFVNHPASSTYDICGTTYCQQFASHNNSANTDLAVQQTLGLVLTTATGAIAFSEFSKENNNHGCGNGYTGVNTADNPCIYDPVCKDVPDPGHTHGRGMCQDGSGRWASGFYNLYSQPHTSNNQPIQTWDWILNHYYPHFSITPGRPLMAGDQIKVFGTGGSGLGVHRCADGGIASGVLCPRVGDEADGSTGTIVGGPTVVKSDGYGYTWWQVQWNAGNLTGWSAENWLTLGGGSCPPDSCCSSSGGVLPASSCPVLSVSLGANPTGGSAPLSSVSLTATVTGSPTQTINYTFYCNRPDTGVNITMPYDWKVNGTYTNPLTIPNLCTYSTPDTYYAKVIVEQGTGQVQSQVQIKVTTVTPSCNSLSLTRNNSSGGGLPTASPANSAGCGAGKYIAGQSIQLTAYPASGWSVGGWNGTQNDSSTSTVNSLVMPASAAYVNVNYVYTPPTGGVRVDGTLDGMPWSGPISFYFQGPVRYDGSWVTSLYQGVPAGNYALFYNGGTPPGAILTSITPSSYQYLAPNGGIAFSFNFSTPAGYPINVATGAADSITQTSAVLHGSANPNGAATNGFFWYGIFPYLVNMSPVTALGSTKTDHPFAAQVTGLSCGTQYYFSTDASNSLGESTGGAQPFNTASCVSSSPGTAFYTLNPCRLVDTRNPSDPNGPAITTNEGRTLVFVGKCGIPTTATAVSLNFTAVNPSADGFLTLYPASAAPPSNWTVNFRQGQVRASNAIVGLSTYGAMTVYCGLVSSGKVDYVVDVNGYFQ
jgi:hypothetical protein